MRARSWKRSCNRPEHPPTRPTRDPSPTCRSHRRRRSSTACDIGRGGKRMLVVKKKLSFFFYFLDFTVYKHSSSGLEKHIRLLISLMSIKKLSLHLCEYSFSYRRSTTSHACMRPSHQVCVRSSPCRVVEKSKKHGYEFPMNLHV